MGRSKFSSEDRELGLNRRISRRDFLNGVAVTAGAVAAGQLPSAAAQGAAPDPTLRTGLSGQYEGSNAVMHAVRDGARFDFAAARDTRERYDLVVVGAGISGLAAAFHYRQLSPGAKVLLVEALDNFGGHAQRNTFRVGGRTLIGYGGSQSMQTPSYFSPAVRKMLSDVGIEPAKFEGYYDGEWFDRRGLGDGMFFAREVFGADRLVRRAEKAADWVPRTPLGAKAKQDLIRLTDGPPDYLAGKSRAEKFELLSRTTYRDFLLNIVKADPQLVTLFQSSTEPYFGVGIDATTCLDAWGNYNPGFDGMDLGERIFKTMSPSGRLARTDPDPYIYHFPDGNAGIARALVRRLIPGALRGSTMEDLVTERVDMSQLDRPNAGVRIRLNASAVRVRHLGAPGAAREVEVAYAGPRGLETVRGAHVVLACWHKVIPYLTDELPPEQAEALKDQVKVPLLYTNVAIRNWRAFDRLKIGSFGAPGTFFANDVGIDFPVSMGRYRFAQRPDEPVILHLGKVMTSPGKSSREQALEGRRRLLGLSFGDLERTIRDLLGRALSGGGFDPARDIAAITVNRWAHGYAYEYMRPWDAFWPDGPLPIQAARRRWGRVAIANSDSGAYAYAHSAIDQAVRAVRELVYARPDAPAFAPFPGPPVERLEFFD